MIASGHTGGMNITQVGDIRLGWGESLVWDDREQRLYFVDCMASSLHWVGHDDVELRTMKLSSMPTGVVPVRDGRLVVVLDDGLSVVDVDRETEQHLTGYPPALGGRCNDACADPGGNVITGRLNLGPEPGTLWRWSAPAGWTLLDDGISNTNGPNVVDLDGRTTLLVGDTAADYFAYPYDAERGALGARRVFGSVMDLAGHPDGATVDDRGGYWCALVGGAQIARFTTSGLDRTISVPVENPTDVTFGGPDLDRLYVTAIDGPLLVIDGVGERGRPEPRCAVVPAE